MNCLTNFIFHYLLFTHSTRGLQANVFYVFLYEKCRFLGTQTDTVETNIIVIGVSPRKSRIVFVVTYAAVIGLTNKLLGRRHAQMLMLRNGLGTRSEEHTSELQSRQYLVCRLLLEKKKKK